MRSSTVGFLCHSSFATSELVIGIGYSLLNQFQLAWAAFLQNWGDLFTRDLPGR